MKIEEDICQTSMDILVDKCRAFLNSKISSPLIWFPDHTAYPPNEIKSDSSNFSVIHIILFGSFVQRLLEMGNWPKANYIFWVLCTPVRNLLIQLCGFPEETVHLIPRYALFPLDKIEGPLPNSSSIITLVFSGRISATKNIESVIWYSYFLQKDFNIPIQLILCGDFDSELHCESSQEDHSDYRLKLYTLINRLNWNLIPSILPKSGPNQWHQQKFINPIFVSFSTYIREDFGVALAQAQQQGWPCLISDWGAHQDVTGRFIFKVHQSRIARSYEPESLIKFKSKALAAHTHSWFKLTSAGEVTLLKQEITKNPTHLDEKSLDHIRRAFISKMGTSVHLIYRETLDYFLRTHDGRVFFSSYKLIFSGQEAVDPCLLIIYDKLDERLQIEVNRFTDFILMAKPDVFRKDSLETVIRAKKIILATNPENISKTFFLKLVTLSSIVGKCPLNPLSAVTPL